MRTLRVTLSVRTDETSLNETCCEMQGLSVALAPTPNALAISGRRSRPAASPCWAVSGRPVQSPDRNEVTFGDRAHVRFLEHNERLRPTGRADELDLESIRLVDLDD